MPLVVALLVVAAFVLWRSKGASGAGPQLPQLPNAQAPDNLPYLGGDALDNISQAISQFESANPKYNNPGALENKSGQFVTYADQGDGWDALNSYITRHAAANPNWDFYDFFQNYLGQQQGGPSVTDQGDSNSYAEYVAGYLGVDPTQTVSSVLNGG